MSLRAKGWVSAISFALFAGLLFVAGRHAGWTQFALMLAAGAFLAIYGAMSSEMTRERIERARRGQPEE